jgi:hypothetical protein
MVDIRILEDEAKKELDEKLNNLGMAVTQEVKTEGSVKSTPF